MSTNDDRAVESRIVNLNERSTSAHKHTGGRERTTQIKGLQQATEQIVVIYLSFVDYALSSEAAQSDKTLLEKLHQSTTGILALVPESERVGPQDNRQQEYENSSNHTPQPRLEATSISDDKKSPMLVTCPSHLESCAVSLFQEKGHQAI
ncbi:hypothetical protein H9L39_19043 [Fusarium oxysporum f. sp. albedinis]|nr:hypothetical protein H9L39_19043 [Fusarium oxysporum f. sp. albedinis]